MTDNVHKEFSTITFLVINSILTAVVCYCIYLVQFDEDSKLVFNTFLFTLASVATFLILGMCTKIIISNNQTRGSEVIFVMMLAAIVIDCFPIAWINYQLFRISPLLIMLLVFGMFEETARRNPWERNIK